MSERKTKPPHPDRCDTFFVHESIAADVKENLPSDYEVTELAEFFKVLGDPTRMRIISALAHTELCVCDISYILNMTQSAISHQLRVLRKSRLVKNRREGKIVYYSLDDDHVLSIFAEGLTHINELR